MTEATHLRMSNFALLLACYRSDQISERQWQEHLKDEVFRKWLEKQGRGGWQRSHGG